MDRTHLEFLKVYEFDDKMRLGLSTDGGYVLANLPGGYDCYVSAGVGREESFTRDFINKYNMNEFNSFGIDASIDEYPSEYTNNISFIKKNISGENTSCTTNLFPLISKYNDIFLKIDVEGGEYPWIQSLSLDQLSKFKQIVMECHGINNDSWGFPYSLKASCLEKLTKTHYLVHAHGNNSRSTTNYIPNIIELTYVRKDQILSPAILNTKSLPIEWLDYPNNKNRPDHNMNMYPFVA